MRLSYTQISQYQSCPLCYKLQYIDNLEPKEKSYFSFGSTMHACTEHFFKRLSPPSLDELLQFYEQNWESAGYESPEQEAEYRAYGREILSKFWEAHHTNFKVPVAIERQFYVDIEGIKLGGKIDRVDKLDSGGLAIVDYKTSRELFTANQLQKDLQLTLYQIAAEQTWQLPVHKLTLYHLRSNTACSCEPRSEVQLEEARQLVLEIARKIEAKDFPATENDFCPCDFEEHCPYHRQKYLAVTAPEETDILRGMSLDELVERYATLQNQTKQLELEVDELRQMIVAFCQAEAVNRLYGKEHAITCKLIDKTGFNGDEVKCILEPEGLWERVLGFDQALVKQLIDDMELAGDIRCKVAALRKVVSTYPRLTVTSLIEED